MTGVTSGAITGTGGGHPDPVLRAYAAGAALLFAAILVNIASHLHEQPELPAWKPVTWEVSSFVGCLLGMGIVFRAVRGIGWRSRAWPVVALLHLAAATAFSVVHCLTMWGLRRVVYTLAATPYGWDMPLGQALYEYRKDLLTYAILAGIYSGLCRVAEPPAAAAARTEQTGAATLDIRDGPVLHRLPVAEILSAESAGNYVTITRRGGQPKMMRATLAQTEAALAPHGFLRVHRSWVVNPTFIQQVERTEAGDHRLGLEGGLTVPMSRRYAAAIRTILGRQATRTG